MELELVNSEKIKPTDLIKFLQEERNRIIENQIMSIQSEYEVINDEQEYIRV